MFLHKFNQLFKFITILYVKCLISDVHILLFEFQSNEYQLRMYTFFFLSLHAINVDVFIYSEFSQSFLMFIIRE